MAVLLAFRKGKSGRGRRLPTLSDAFVVYLGLRPGASVLELCDYFQIGQSRTTRTCQALQREGTVKLRKASDDRRRTVVKLTAQGLRILDDARTLFREGKKKR